MNGAVQQAPPVVAQVANLFTTPAVRTPVNDQTQFRSSTTTTPGELTGQDVLAAHYLHVSPLVSFIDTSVAQSRLDDDVDQTALGNFYLLRLLTKSPNMLTV